MQVYDEANVLSRAIRDCEESRNYRALKEEIEQNETSRALLKEYKKLQMQLQLAAVSGAETNDDDVRRFQQIGSLMFTDPKVSQFLLCEMRLQQMMADIYKLLSDAAGLDMPGME